MPAANAKRRPLTRPSEIRRVRPAASASATCRAASTGSRGSPSARESTLAPPPGRKPIGTSDSSPFRASLKPPSPEKTTTASAPPRHAPVTSSVAWPGRSVRRTSSSATRSSSARTSASRSSLTRVANGLTTSAIAHAPSLPAERAAGKPRSPPRMRRPPLPRQQEVERRRVVELGHPALGRRVGRRVLERERRPVVEPRSPLRDCLRRPSVLVGSGSRTPRVVELVIQPCVDGSGDTFQRERRPVVEARTDLATVSAGRTGRSPRADGARSRGRRA